MGRHGRRGGSLRGEGGMTHRTATYDAATGMVTLSTGRWSETFRADLLPRKIALYRHLRDRAGGKYRAIYAADVEALEAAQREVTC